MAGDQLDHALPAWLLDGFDACTFQVLAQQHDKRGRLRGNFRGFARCQMRPRQLWMRRQIEPAILPALSTRARTIALDGNGIFGWLNNCIDTRSREQGSPLIGNGSKCNSIYKHKLILFITILLSRSYTLGTRATARVPTPHPRHPRPYNDDGNGFSGSFIVGSGVVERTGGDPCGRPRRFSRARFPLSLKNVRARGVPTAYNGMLYNRGNRQFRHV